MAAITEFESRLLLARAICEIAAGEPGPGVAHARNLVSLAESGRIVDPYAQQRDVPKGPVVPFEAKRTITNADLDGRVNQAHTGPTVGTRDWFAARRKARA
jgi:hypothetical protein